MANEHTKFWLALLDQSQDIDCRARLWNGYLGWRLPPKWKGKDEPPQHGPTIKVEPPYGAWPELTTKDREIIERLAEKHGGHPEITRFWCMDFSGHLFSENIDFSGLILFGCNFEKAEFDGEANFSDTRIYSDTLFRGARFNKGISCQNTLFDGSVYFTRACFKGWAVFLDVQFMGDASYTDVIFENKVMFNGSRFEERYWGPDMASRSLADFRNAKFMATTTFDFTVFGSNESESARNLWPERVVDFTDSEFRAETSFRGSVFRGVPAFFNVSLHEDTDFGGVDWDKAQSNHVPAHYAVRAWERLELMMSRLEKPFDRHQFFRLKMRARRRLEPALLRAVNWLFDKLADYGWGIERTLFWWLCHWVVSGLALYANTSLATENTEWYKLLLAALATGFANAHAFLRLTAEGGYLDPCQKLLEENDKWDLLTTAVGTFETVGGPILLFLVLLTLRNRFRLA